MIKDVDSLIQKLTQELTMGGYHDGWTLKWIKEKIKELEEIKKSKNDIGSILNKKTK